MGRYNKREITIDDTRFELYYFDEKGALFSSLEATREGLVQGIGEAKAYFEKLTGEVYPFHNWLSLKPRLVFVLIVAKIGKGVNGFNRN